MVKSERLLKGEYIRRHLYDRVKIGSLIYERKYQQYFRKATVSTAFCVSMLTCGVYCCDFCPGFPTTW